MYIIIFGLIFFLILLLIAIRVGVNKEDDENEVHPPVIHTSGIYSIVRQSPREHIGEHKPSLEELRKYLSSQNEDIHGHSLSEKDREMLVEKWQTHMEKSISEIEKGDKDGIEFYYYGYSQDDPVCREIIAQGRFVTREQIYQYPGIIPPFHPGCNCELRCYRGDENLRDTTVMGMRSLFNEKSLPPLPEWKTILLQPQEK